MSYSKTNIANIALRLLGQARITDIDTDTTNAGLQIADALPLARQEVLRSHPWNFAAKRIYLGENWLLQSETFGTTWTTSNVTVSSNSLRAPDGNTTADTLTDASASAGTILQAVTVPNNSDTFTFSVYLFPGTAAITTLVLAYSVGTGVSLTQNITWGATPTVDAGSLESIGDGWWRFSLSLTNNATGNTTLTATIYPASSTAASQGTVYAWGAQITRTGAAVGYVATTTVAKRVVIPAFGHGYAHALPSDFIRVVDVNEGEVQYKVEAGYLLADSSFVALRYVFDQDTYTLWDALAAKLLAAQIAEDCCVALTGSDSRMAQIIAFRRMVKGAARTVDGQEDGEDPPVMDTWELARHTGRVWQAP